MADRTLRRVDMRATDSAPSANVDRVARVEDGYFTIDVVNACQHMVDTFFACELAQVLLVVVATPAVDLVPLMDESAAGKHNS